MEIKLIKIVLLIWLMCFISCGSKTKKIRKTIDKFSIQEYYFEVDLVTVIDNKTKATIRSYYDTTLVNLCDFYEEFEECEDDDYSRGGETGR